MVTFALMCTIVVSLCVALYAAGTKLDHVLSEHRLNLYCEGKSEVYTLSAVAD